MQQLKKNRDLSKVFLIILMVGFWSSAQTILYMNLFNMELVIGVFMDG